MPRGELACVLFYVIILLLASFKSNSRPTKTLIAWSIYVDVIRMSSEESMLWWICYRCVFHKTNWYWTLQSVWMGFLSDLSFSQSFLPNKQTLSNNFVTHVSFLKLGVGMAFHFSYYLEWLKSISQKRKQRRGKNGRSVEPNSMTNMILVDVLTGVSIAMQNWVTVLLFFMWLLILSIGEKAILFFGKWKWNMILCLYHAISILITLLSNSRFGFNLKHC